MAFPSTPYVTAEHTSAGPLTDPSPYVDLSLLGAEFWALVDTSDGTKGRVFKEDETELAVVWLSFDDGAETGGLRFKWSGTWSAAGANTVRIYPPLAARASVASGDAFGKFNAFDDYWRMYLTLDQAVTNAPDGYTDETRHGSHGQGVSMAIAASAGQVGDAQNFDGAADYIDVGTMGTFGSGMSVNNTTVSAWVESSDTINIMSMLGTFSTGPSTALRLTVNEGSGGSANAGHIRTFVRDEDLEQRIYGVNSNTGVTDGSRHHLVAVLFPDSEPKIYVDAVLQTVVSFDTDNTDNMADFEFPLFFGATNTRGTVSQLWTGQKDEGQIHTTDRSADWIEEEVAATKNPGTYWGVWEFVGDATQTATSAAAFTTVAAVSRRAAVTATSAAALTTVAVATFKAFATATSAASFRTVAAVRWKASVTATSAESFATVAAARLEVFATATSATVSITVADAIAKTVRTATSAAAFTTVAAAVAKTVRTATSAAAFFVVALAERKFVATATPDAAFSTVAVARLEAFATATSAAAFRTVAAGEEGVDLVALEIKKALGTLGWQSQSHERHSDQSESGANLTVSTSTGERRRILFVTVKYSGSATVNVTVTLNSGAGAAWDVILQTIALSAATQGIWIPDRDVVISADDVFDVFAPLLSSETSSVAIYSEIF